jgi:predicted dehydrogenase
MTQDSLNIGVIGCGNISEIYLTNIRRFAALNLVAVSDMDMDKANAKAAAHEVAACSVTELLARDDIDLVINLTIPAVHAEVSQQILAAGKHVYSEKPLATNRRDGQALLETARANNLYVGCAPDTFLGAGLQTCRKLIDDGWLGRPLAATASFVSSGPESWHPNPDFFYQPGAGPLFDMAPYYLSSLINFLGPVKRLVGMASQGFSERIATSPSRFGERIPVSTPTHVSALLEFHSGATTQLLCSFDVPASNLPRIEIYGEQASLSVPDPNIFGGEVYIQGRDHNDWQAIPHAFGYADNSRALGVADMAHAILSGRPARASGELALHVLDIMESILTSSQNGQYLTLETTCDRPAALPLGLLAGVLD